MTDYVLVYVENSARQVLFVEKNKPEWQKGRFNLVGGKIEDGEGKWEAADRELLEETGLVSHHTQLCGSIVGKFGVVYVFRAYTRTTELFPQDGEVEIFFWDDWESLRHSPLLLPNLRVIIPLMKCGLRGWKITDDQPSSGSDTHTFSVTVQA